MACWEMPPFRRLRPVMALAPVARPMSTPVVLGTSAPPESPAADRSDTTIKFSQSCWVPRRISAMRGFRLNRLPQSLCADGRQQLADDVSRPLWFCQRDVAPIRHRRARGSQCVVHRSLHRRARRRSGQWVGRSNPRRMDGRHRGRVGICAAMDGKARISFCRSRNRQ